MRFYFAPDSKDGGSDMSEAAPDGSDAEETRTKVNGGGAAPSSDDSDDEQQEDIDDDVASEADKDKSKKGKAKKGSLNTAGKIQCRGCSKFELPTDMYPNSNLAKDCKKIYDCLAKLASKQKQAVWWKETRRCPKKLKRVHS